MHLVRLIYIGTMALGGVALGAASVHWPVIHDGPVPPMMSLLMISLVMDLVIMNRAAAGQMQPLQMNERLIGFFASAILYFILRMGLA